MYRKDTGLKVNESKTHMVICTHTHMHDETLHMFHIKILVPLLGSCQLSLTPSHSLLLSVHLTVYVYVGSRGVSIEQYLNISGSSVSELKNSDKFPDQPDNFLTYPAFQPENSNTMYVCS